MEACGVGLPDRLYLLAFSRPGTVVRLSVASPARRIGTQPRGSCAVVPRSCSMLQGTFHVAPPPVS